MSVFDSECSSGCESGWTVYFEQSFHNKNASSYGVYSVEEEEDLSMVSDASSGPPHLPDDDVYINEEDSNCFFSASRAVKKPVKSGIKKQKVKESKHLKDYQQHLPSFLHDTASSPLFDFSENTVENGTNRQSYRGSMLEYSQGFSANNFEERRSSFQEEQFGFLQPSSLSENDFQGNNKWYGGKDEISSING